MTLPLGRARLATRPAGAEWVRRDRENDRDDRCRLLCRDDRGSRRDNDIDLQSDELGRNLGVAFAASLRPAIFDPDVAAFDITGRIERFGERHRMGHERILRSGVQESDHRHPRLLGTHGERPSGGRAA